MDTQSETDKLGRRRRAARGGSAFVTAGELHRLTGLSEATIWRMRQRGDLDEPVNLSPGRKAWARTYIEARFHLGGDR